MYFARFAELRFGMDRIGCSGFEKTRSGNKSNGRKTEKMRKTQDLSKVVKGKKTMKRKVISCLLCVILAFLQMPIFADAADVNRGTVYYHIDVKVDGEYTVTVDGEKITLSGELQKDTIKVRIGDKTYSFSDYNITQVTEDGRKEYEISLTRPWLSPDSIVWVEGTYRMTNVYLSGRMLFSSVPDNIKSILPTTVVGGKAYHYVDIADYQYDGVNECTGGRGMRSEGKTGIPIGLDIFIQASGMQVILTKGKLALKKVVEDEDGYVLTAEDDAAVFDYVITDADGEPLYFLDGVYSDGTAEGASSIVSVVNGSTVLLDGIPAGTYKITEIQKDGYVIHEINGNETEQYTTDYVVKVKTDDEIPVAVFTNLKLSEKSAVCIRKTADGAVDVVYPDPKIKIYAFEDGQKQGEPIWSCTLSANGDAIYPTVYFAPGTYLVEESGQDMEGFDCAVSLNDGSEMTFTVSTEADLIMLNVHNLYDARPDPEYTSLKVTKVWSGEGEHPASVEIQLYKDGEAFGDPVELGEGNGWSCEWTELDDGYTWTVDEVNVPEGYTKKVEHEGTEWTVTNIADETDPEYTSLKVTKVWSGEGEHPASVEVQLFRYGEAFGKPVELSEGNGWTYEWAELEYGYTWTVDEVNVPEGYVKSVEHEGTEWTVTNTANKPNEPEGPNEPDGPNVPDVPDVTNVPDQSNAPNVPDNPKMGDDPYTLLWIAITALSGAAFLGIILRSKRRSY